MADVSYIDHHLPWHDTNILQQSTLLSRLVDLDTKDSSSSSDDFCETLDGGSGAVMIEDDETMSSCRDGTT